MSASSLEQYTFAYLINSALALVPDIETDDELRERYLETITEIPFGGNVAHYKSIISDLLGVGDVQVYPTWNGGGTVKCSVISSTYTPVSSELLSSIQQTVDPNVEGSGLGLAPIGHHVTIVTPTTISININATLTLLAGFTIEQVQTDVETSISEYILELCKAWGNSNNLNEYGMSVYLSRIIACILKVAGISNVSTVTINNVSADYVLTETASTQQIPTLGTVTLNE